MDPGCAVCSRPPAKGKKHFSFFGAIVCMSCKAFFKRCHDLYITSEGKLKYTCKNEQNNAGEASDSEERRCDTHYLSGSKMKCKHCRYLKCLAAGMDPSRIKSGEERQKYTRINLFCFKKKDDLVAGDIQDVDLNARMNQIVHAYKTSLSKIGSADSSLIEFLVSGHHNGTCWTQRHTQALLTAVNIHPRSIMDMTTMLDFFQLIEKEDQMLLFHNNSHLFYQYIFSRYIMADVGSTQIAWLMGSDVDVAELFGNSVSKFQNF